MGLEEKFSRAQTRKLNLARGVEMPSSTASNLGCLGDGMPEFLNLGSFNRPQPHHA